MKLLVGLFLLLSHVVLAQNWKGHKLSLLLGLSLIFLCFQANGQTTYTAIGSGNWNTAGTWDANGIPPTTLPSTDFIFISCGTCTISNDTGGAIVIDGSLTVGAYTTLDMEDQDLTIGFSANTATLTIDQDGNLEDVNFLKAKRDISPDGDVGNGPFINNSGTITAVRIPNIGQNMGGGKLTNTSTGVITITGGKMHVDGIIDNAGTISVTGNIDLHGAIVTGGGNFNVTGEIKMHKGAGAGGATQGGPVSVLSQAFGDGAGCSSADSATPLYSIDGSTYTYQELLDAFGATDGTHFSVDADNVSSCGEAPLACDPEATAAAGTDALICYNATHTLAATATNGSILWSTSGDGTFTNATLEDPVYTPGSVDISAGTVTLTMTVTGSCDVSSDDMVLTIDPEVTASAGTDAQICYNATHSLAATATNGTILWTTTGDGTFDDATAEDPVYTFGSGDISAGLVTLTMIVTGNCNIAPDNVVLTIDPAAAALAGSSTLVCFNTPYSLAATATNGSILWTSSGDGTFDDVTLEDPVYTFGSGDISGGIITLTMTVTGNCNIASDNMVLTIDPEATAQAGADALVCYNAPHLLEAMAANGTILWSTSGDGTFNNATLEDPVYSFGSGDVSAAIVILTMTVTGNCDTTTDDVILFGDTEASAKAGADAIVCYNTPYLLEATAANGTILWSSSGDGTFNNATLEDPVYSFGSGDVSAGIVILTMAVTGNCNIAPDYVVLINDIEPVITNCPSDIVVLVSGTGCDEAGTWTAPMAADNCSIAALTSTHNPGDIFPMGTTMVTYIALDASGNFSTCSFNVTVEDSISPLFEICPDEVSISEFDLDTQSAAVTWQTPVASDNCGLVTISSNYNSGDSFPRGVTKVIYTAIDESGNEATCEFEIDIIGNSFPIASPVSEDAYSGEPEEICLDVIDPDGDDVFITEINYSMLNGKIDRTDESGLCLNYTPFDHFVGDDIFSVKVCDDGTPVACIDVEVRVQVTINLTLTIYKAFTPDGDNINDVWTIENIDNHPDNQVIIFDRWGGLIFSARGYNNENVVWDGRSNQSGQGPVPSGTYFYKIELGNGYPVQKGFVELIQ